MESLKSINLFGTELKFSDEIVVSANRSFSSVIDTKILINVSNITLTLDFANNQNGVKVDVFAFTNCWINYFVDGSNIATLYMAAGTRAVFVYYNGWRYNGMYGAVWN